MLKLKLTSLDGLDPLVAAEYKQDGTGFILDTDVVYEDVKPLKSALQAEKTHRLEATKKVTELEETVSTLESRALPAKDLEKAYQDKLVKAKEVSDARERALKTNIETLLVDNVATTMAGEVSTAPELLKPHILKRLTAVEEDGRYVTRVLDAEGKLSANSVNELKSEVLADTRFAPILVASKASGGGAQGGKGGGGGASAKHYKDMSEAERTNLFNTDRPKFDLQRAEFQKIKSEPAKPAEAKK